MKNTNKNFGKHNSISIKSIKSSEVVIKGDHNQIIGFNNNIQNMKLFINGGNFNKVEFNGLHLDNTRITINGNNNTIIFGSGSIIPKIEIVINGDNHSFVLGENVEIFLNAAFWFEDSNNNISIGKSTTIGSLYVSVAEPNANVSIGSKCMIAKNVTIMSSDFHSIVDFDNRRINQATRVVIKDHVWLGTNSYILKNVIINENSVVALGSIVTKDVPAGCIVGGNPAKIIKENVNWVRERI